MRHGIILITLFLTLFCGACFAQKSDSVAATAPAAHYDSSAVKFNQSTMNPAADTIKKISTNKSDSLAKAAPNAAAALQPEKLKLIRRTYNSRQQVMLATFMMIFVVGIMTMAQQWNPR
jgi:hypothetical protein